MHVKNPHEARMGIQKPVNLQNTSVFFTIIIHHFIKKKAFG